MAFLIITRYTHVYDVPHAEQKLWQSVNLDEVDDFEDMSGVNRAVICLSYSRAVSERSESLCASLLSLSYCRLSSLRRFLHLWTHSLAWCHHLSSKSSIYVNSYTSVVNLLRTHTYKHNLRLRPHKHPWLCASCSLVPRCGGGGERAPVCACT